MNIEKIFSPSFKIFSQTISSVVLFIIVYTVFLSFFSIEMDKAFSLSNDISIIYLFIAFFTQLLYFILVTQFIFHQITKTKIIFNIKFIIESIYKIIGLYILILVPSISIIIIFISIHQGASILFGIIPILLFITIFSNYIIINEQKNIFESIADSYVIVKNNLSEVLILVMINIIFLFFIVMLSSIGLAISLLFGSVLINIFNYFTSIFNIQFYYLLTSRSRNNNE